MEFHKVFQGHHMNRFTSLYMVYTYIHTFIYENWHQCFSEAVWVFNPRSSVCSSPGFGGTSGMLYKRRTALRSIKIWSFILIFFYSNILKMYQIRAVILMDDLCTSKHRQHAGCKHFHVSRPRHTRGHLYTSRNDCN